MHLWEQLEVYFLSLSSRGSWSNVRAFVHRRAQLVFGLFSYQTLVRFDRRISSQLFISSPVLFASGWKKKGHSRFVLPNPTVTTPCGCGAFEMRLVWTQLFCKYKMQKMSQRHKYIIIAKLVSDHLLKWQYKQSLLCMFVQVHRNDHVSWNDGLQVILIINGETSEATEIPGSWEAEGGLWVWGQPRYS
jgi:hypothetical protein